MKASSNEDENDKNTAAASAHVARQIKELLREKENCDDRTDAARLDELRRIFAKLVADGEMTLDPSSVTTARTKWVSFLRSSHKHLVDQLKQRIIQGKRTAIRTLWGVMATTPVTSSNGQYQLLQVPLLVHWVQAMTRCAATWDQAIQHMVQAEFVQPYRDVQYFTMVAVQRVAAEVHSRDKPQKKKKRDMEENDLNEKEQETDSKHTRAAERLLQILMLIPLATSQSDLDVDTKAYLFPPPENATPDDDQDNDDDPEQDSDDGDDDNSSIDPSDDDDDDSDDHDEPKAKRQKPMRIRFNFEQVRKHRREWAKAWMAVLKLELPMPALKQALQFLPTHVLPHVSNPLLFADFFIQAYQHDGVVPILALDGLFVLLTQHGLEYPDYYKQLYKLVTSTLFYVRYRTRFFRLLDRSIARNDLLPAATVAAFIKRLMRASLQAPPAGIMTALALCSNWLRKHPETLVLVHAASSAQPTANDPFDATTNDPTSSHALQSSLWELHALSQHYYPAVVTLAAAVGNPAQDQAPMLEMEDFYAQSYHNLLEQERKRHRKSKKTPLTFRAPTQLFSSSDIFDNILDIPTTTVDEPTLE